MPLALGLVALMLIIVGIKGNYADLGAAFNQTFLSGATSTGGAASSGFIVWFGSIFGIAVLFRLIGAPKAGELFIVLLIVVYFVENQTALPNIQSALTSAGNSGSSAPTASTALSSAVSGATASAGAAGAASVSSAPAANSATTKVGG